MKARVAIIYSHSTANSNESRNLAYYFCSQLLSTGYCDVHLVGVSPDGSPCDYPHRPKIICSKYPTSKPLEVPASDIVFSHWNVISDCHMIIITVNTTDTVTCSKKLVEILQTKKTIPVFSLQRGVKNSSIIKEEVETKQGMTVIEAVVGFGVGMHPKTQSLTPTCYPSLMFERVTKEAEKLVNGPLNLIEAMKIEVYYRKVLTPFSWGVLVYECLHYLNGIHQGSLRQTISDPKYRLVLAMMTRECRDVLYRAARGGSWKPDFLMISSILSPWLWEMLLLMPWPIFDIITFLVQMRPSPIPSPCLNDLNENRTTSVDWMLGDIIETGKNYDIKTPMLHAVYQQIKELESSQKGPRLRSDVIPTNRFQDIEAVMQSVRVAHNNRIPSYSDLMSLVLKLVIGLILLNLVLYFIIFVDW